jgi:hypothetical protein
LPGFFLGVISNIDYSNTLAMNTWLYKLETDNFAMRFYNSVGVLVVLFIIYQIYLFYVNKLGMALVLATVNNEYYQDFGDYFIIFYCGWLAVREYNRKRLQRTDRSYFIFSLVIMIEIVISVLFLQIIGSNKAPLTVVAIGLFYLYFSSEGILMYRLRQLAAIFLISTVGLLAFLGFVDPEIISSLRYFNEAELNGFSNNSSISSRWDQLVGEGTYQLNNNWLFGDLSIENYIHSSLITIQTHTGLIGSLMFWMFFIVQGYYIYFRRDDKFLKSVTLPIVFVSIVSSVFWWLPLWFLAGLIYARK